MSPEPGPAFSRKFDGGEGDYTKKAPIKLAPETALMVFIPPRDNYGRREYTLGAGTVT
jgi:hypothetical protein